MYHNHNEVWREHARCKGMDPTPWFPDKGKPGGSIEAQRICAECPVNEDCLNYSVVRPERHGIFGGAGEDRRKYLRRLQSTCPHPQSGTRFECRCAFCREVAVHLERLAVLAATGRGPSPARRTFGPRATHGRKSTGKRGCGCNLCRSALRGKCERGHPFTDKSTLERVIDGQRARVCRECQQEKAA